MARMIKNYKLPEVRTIYECFRSMECIGTDTPTNSFTVTSLEPFNTRTPGNGAKRRRQSYRARERVLVSIQSRASAQRRRSQALDASY